MPNMTREACLRNWRRCLSVCVFLLTAALLELEDKISYHSIVITSYFIPLSLGFDDRAGPASRSY